MAIRHASADDTAVIHALCVAAFDESEAERVARLAIELLLEPNAFSLVAEDQDRVIGFISFSAAQDAQGATVGHILAPLAVDPSHQGKGHGSALVEAGIAALKADASARVFVYGDPAYYGRFGFTEAQAANYRPAYGDLYLFWVRSWGDRIRQLKAKRARNSWLLRSASTQRWRIMSFQMRAHE